MTIKLQLPELTDLRPRLAVIGVGGAGCNAVNNMIAAGLDGVEFIVANTDAQALAASSAEHTIQLGASLTEGLGAGSKPEIGQAAAEEAVEEIRAQISGCHMVFVAAGMGGGTGTGAAAIIARTAKELGILTVGVVTKPFQFEGARRMRIAEAGIAELKKTVDTLIVIPNQNLFRLANERTTFSEAFILADQVLYSGVACIVDLIIKEGLINLDFADVRTVIAGMGTAMMGTGEADGENRAIIAAEEAIANPLLDDVSLKGAKGLLLSITGSSNLTLYEVDEAASRVREEVDPEANIIVGATFDESLGERVRVSIVASGMTRPAGMADEPVWPRYQDAAPPQPQGGAAQGSYAAGEGEPGNMRQRLSEALQFGAGVGDYADVTQQTPPPPPQHDDGHPPASVVPSWTAPGNVTIEEGLPAMEGFGRQDHGGNAYSRADGGGVREPVSFEPQAAAQLPAGARRMPGVEDFPPIAQREYLEKTRQLERPEARSATATSKPAARRSLFDRLTGRTKSASDSAVDKDENDSPALDSRRQDKTTNLKRNPAGDETGQEFDSEKQDQGADIPMFFGRQAR